LPLARATCDAVGMFCVSVNLTSGEWLTIAQPAAKEWTNENPSCAEIVRRYTLSGIEALKDLSAAERR
jgi:hypothetical protein